MEENLIKNVAAIIAPHLAKKHKDALSVEIAKKILETVRQDTLEKLDDIIKP